MTDVGVSKSAWVCVRTEVHREAIASENLRRSGLEVFYPRYQRWISSARRKQLVLRPLFPNYVFAKSADGIDRMGHVKRTPGVCGLAAHDLISAVVPDAVIDALRERQNAEGYFDLSHQRFVRGEMVRLNAGPFVDLEAVFSERKDEHRSLILLSMLGKQHPIEVLSNFLDKVA